MTKTNRHFALRKNCASNVGIEASVRRFEFCGRVVTGKLLSVVRNEFKRLRRFDQVSIRASA